MPLTQSHSYSLLIAFWKLVDLNHLPAEYLLPNLSDSLFLTSDVNDLSNDTRSFTSLAQSPMSKRKHALLELLSSERQYASDMALIRDIHILLALGIRFLQLHICDIDVLPGSAIPFYTHLVTSSLTASLMCTLSTMSDSSASTSMMGPPMTQEDTKVIFSNIAELAVFSDMLVEQLEEALGQVLDGGTGNDNVGALFLEIIFNALSAYKIDFGGVDTSYGTSVQDIHHMTTCSTIILEFFTPEPSTHRVSQSHQDPCHIAYSCVGSIIHTYQTCPTLTALLISPVRDYCRDS